MADYIFVLPNNKTAIFTATTPKRVSLGQGMVLVSATIKAKDGTSFDAVIKLDESSAGEHWETFFLIPGQGIIRQGDTGWLKRLGKTRKQVFPYQYQYHVKLKCRDFHIDADGWSK